MKIIKQRKKRKPKNVRVGQLWVEDINDGYIDLLLVTSIVDECAVFNGDDDDCMAVWDMLHAANNGSSWFLLQEAPE